MIPSSLSVHARACVRVRCVCAQVREHGGKGGLAGGCVCGKERRTRGHTGRRQTDREYDREKSYGKGEVCVCVCARARATPTAPAAPPASRLTAVLRSCSCSWVIEVRVPDPRSIALRHALKAENLMATNVMTVLACAEWFSLQVGVQIAVRGAGGRFIWRAEVRGQK